MGANDWVKELLVEVVKFVIVIPANYKYFKVGLNANRHVSKCVYLKC